jgi:hypothetical protein
MAGRRAVLAALLERHGAGARRAVDETADLLAGSL